MRRSRTSSEFSEHFRVRIRSTKFWWRQSDYSEYISAIQIQTKLKGTPAFAKEPLVHAWRRVVFVWDSASGRSVIGGSNPLRRPHMSSGLGLLFTHEVLRSTFQILPFQRKICWHRSSAHDTSKVYFLTYLKFNDPQICFDFLKYVRAHANKVRVR